MTTFRWYLLGLLTLFCGYVALEYYRPKPLDWTPTYENKDKIPYGTYVLYQLLPEVLGGPVQTVRLPAYNQLAPDSLLPADEPAPAAERGSYLFVSETFDVSRPDVEALLRYAARGNDVFIAAERFAANFADTLGFSTRSYLLAHDTATTTRIGLTDSVTLHLVEPGLRRAAGRQFRYPLASTTRRLVLDSLTRAAVLATDAQDRPVLVRLPYGRGTFYLSTVPALFTNYFVLQPRTSNFAFAALSYLPAGRPALWDEYQKQGRTGEDSLLRVLLDHEALRAAYYLLCVGVLLFVAVEARRRQRVIPIINPLPNTTLLFTRTVAGLYRQGRNHALIAEKKTGLFLDYLRTRFQESTQDLNDDAFRERLAQKAGVPRAEVDDIIRLIHFIRTAPAVSDQELLRLSRALQAFQRLAK